MKASKLTPKKIFSEIEKSDMGVLFIKKDKDSFIGKLAEMSKGSSVLFGGQDKTLCCRIYPVMYSDKTSRSPVEIRSKAIMDIFHKWTVLGYNTHHAKSPFGCKAFHDISEQICNADYIIIKE